MLIKPLLTAGAPAALAVVEEEADELLVALSQHGCLPIAIFCFLDKLMRDVGVITS